MIGHRSGPIESAMDAANVVLNGRGGHGARPEATVDPALMAANVVTRLQGIVPREVAPSETAVVTVGRLQAGSKTPRWSGPSAPRCWSATRTVAAFTDAFGPQRLLPLPQLAASEDVGALGAAAGVPTVYWFWGGLDTDSTLAALRDGRIDTLPSNTHRISPRSSADLEHGIRRWLWRPRLTGTGTGGSVTGAAPRATVAPGQTGVPADRSCLSTPAPRTARHQPSHADPCFGSRDASPHATDMRPEAERWPESAGTAGPSCWRRCTWIPRAAGGSRCPHVPAPGEVAVPYSLSSSEPARHRSRANRGVTAIGPGAGGR
jgi:hypothetical protein